MAQTPDPSVIADYDRWLGAVAMRLLGATWTEADLQDLKQEGRVAMWRALETYDEAKGALPSWLTRAAEMRMKDIARGHGQPFGREATRGSREVDTGGSIDAFDEDQIDGLLGYVSEEIHDGEILRVIRERLTPRQQEYVFLRFWGGLDPRAQAPQVREMVKQFPVLAERWQWQRAKPILVDALAHLAEAS